nr:immunoglobulin light chain junction region [Macaca mulatta]MOW34333.1 immunoglobulin light chain junction region [Macaca mulatta]MOW34588.1 immunoglobulin light chain junction region [Macaca mulatta]MOW34634.1 immunoglobulin light chain junction region [Macaca mulatta]MOW34820.1 immunoglobulin light chain junction region [Macaca mulatta]
CQQHNIYPYSF